MARGAINYKSCTYYVHSKTNVLESKSHQGIKCIWTGSCSATSPYRMYFKWKFDWNELKYQGVDKLNGHITLVSVNNSFPPMNIYVELTDNNPAIAHEFESGHYMESVYYQYSLIPHYISKKPSYDEMFGPSEQNDTILVVDGKKLHVSKAFLSYHSDYFRALFSSNYKEGKMDEIPIGDVSYEDFALLLRTFYPDPVFVTDATVEKILEMARRFLVDSVIKFSEHHLLNMSKINNEKMLWMADKYGMPTLLEKCIRGLDTFAKAKQMKKSETYKLLSAETKLKVFDRLMEFI
ncbi:hypothetical protein CRE_06829 [Caenorhabditis remanei]|uniref:BTB domain-containing protein n=1 Tax=Caenorhabditis remanei TaxID=31234 RepID=E3MZQ3_CAERE|nr:hypothetical protein CRE_06829 [Caenorhabditis remanei]